MTNVNVVTFSKDLPETVESLSTKGVTIHSQDYYVS